MLRVYRGRLDFIQNLKLRTIVYLLNNSTHHLSYMTNHSNCHLLTSLYNNYG